MENPRPFLQKLCANRDALLSGLNPNILSVIWPVDIQAKMKHCFDVVKGELLHENAIGTEILLRTVMRHLGGRSGLLPMALLVSCIFMIWIGVKH